MPAYRLSATAPPLAKHYDRPLPDAPDPQRPEPSKRDHREPRSGANDAGRAGPIAAAERAARESSQWSLEKVREAQKAAQRELSARLRLSPRPEAEITRLKSAIKSLQKAEAAKRRAESAPIDEGSATASLGRIATAHSPVLTQADIRAARIYTKISGPGDLDGHYEINTRLRSGTIDEVAEIASNSHDISALLSRLDDHRGTVFRGSDQTLPEEIIDRYQPGKTVVENNYTSSSTSKSIAEAWVSTGNVIWEIESRTGKVLGDLSEHDAEAEVLFDRFSKFEVLERTREGSTDNPVWRIRMQQVE